MTRKQKTETDRHLCKTNDDPLQEAHHTPTCVQLQILKKY